MLVFTMLVSVATGLIFGLAPAHQASRADLNAALNDGTRGTTGTGRQRLRGVLVVSEVALSLVLLVGAGLMIKSFWRLQQVDPGFDSQNLLSVEVTLPASKYPSSQAADSLLSASARNNFYAARGEGGRGNQQSSAFRPAQHRHLSHRRPPGAEGYHRRAVGRFPYHQP